MTFNESRIENLENTEEEVKSESADALLFGESRNSYSQASQSENLHEGQSFMKSPSKFSESTDSPETQQAKEDLMAQKVHQLAVVSALKRANKRFCHHCVKFKPERTHHCRQCGVCVVKMDHHCPWVSNCIGLKNHKFFMNMLIYSSNFPLIALKLISNHSIDASLHLNYVYTTDLLKLFQSRGINCSFSIKY